MAGYLRVPRTVSLLCLLALLVACGPPEVSGTLVVQTEEATPQQIERTAQILAARFEEILPTTMRSAVSSAVTGNTTTFTFRGEAPAEEVLRPRIRVARYKQIHDWQMEPV